MLSGFLTLMGGFSCFHHQDNMRGMSGGSVGTRRPCPFKVGIKKCDRVAVCCCCCWLRWGLTNPHKPLVTLTHVSLQ